MLETTAMELRKDLDAEVKRCIEQHEVLRVRRDAGGDFILMGEDDWRAIEETVYLNGIPGLVESIRESAEEPLSEGTRLNDLEMWPHYE